MPPLDPAHASDDQVRILAERYIREQRATYDFDFEITRQHERFDWLDRLPSDTPASSMRIFGLVPVDAQPGMARLDCIAMVRPREAA